MKLKLPLKFKIASEEFEFEQIHKLNYKTFTEEIPQHKPSSNKRRVDKFHKENTYIICLSGDKLLGMVAVRNCRPFSLDQKLKNLDSYLPQGHSICEIRLFAIEKNNRNSRVSHGLIQFLAQYCESKRYDLAIISGIVKQLKLYKHFGFVPFGPSVGSSNAKFQPMYLTREAFKKSKVQCRISSHSQQVSLTMQTPVNLLPGPVGISHDILRAFEKLPVSHRSKVFLEDFKQVKQSLCCLVHSKYVEILMGSGTLANDTIAGQLSIKSGKGLILSNGEFGNRLIDHAIRFGLSFKTLQMDWGHPFNYKDIKCIIKQNPKISWLWAVHCETSTGILNAIETLKEICGEREIKLCMDCVSSIGTVPVDLQGVYLASGVSGKGLKGLSGLAMVFYNERIPPAPKVLPRYLDLGFYAVHEGIPFTTSSNLLYALKIALEHFKSKERFNHISNLSIWLRAALRKLGFHIVVPDRYTSPAVITIALPKLMNSENIGRQLEEAGYLLSYKSEYLLKRNWIQICLMGECSQKIITPLVNALKEFSPLRRVHQKL